jgi:hypothetical protein
MLHAHASCAVMHVIKPRTHALDLFTHNVVRFSVLPSRPLGPIFLKLSLSLCRTSSCTLSPISLRSQDESMRFMALSFEAKHTMFLLFPLLCFEQILLHPPPPPPAPATAAAPPPHTAHMGRCFVKRGCKRELSPSEWEAHGLAPSHGQDHRVQSGHSMSNSGTSISGVKQLARRIRSQEWQTGYIIYSICMYACMYIRMYVCMYIYIHTCIHTCYVLTNPPIPSSCCKCFVVLRPD